MTAPLYRVIEFCSNAETLWKKLDSGHWDWLGVNTRRDYVVGRPARNRQRSSALTLVNAGAVPGEHGVRVRAPLSRSAPTWYATAAEAIRAFDEEIAKLETLPGSHIFEVVRIEGRAEVDSHIVAKVESNYR